MAKKTDAPNMVERFAEFKELKNIDKTTMISVLEESFRKVLAGMFKSDENFDVIMNPDKGDVQIFQNFEVVADGCVKDPNKEISLTDARADGDPDCEIGEEHTREIVFANFGRRAIQNLRQTLQSKILELQKAAVSAKFTDLTGQLITGEVYQTWSRETLLLDDDKNELLLPKSESIPGDFFRKGETVRVVVSKVDDKNNNPKITVSRTSPDFLRRLFELEVPEIAEGLINIMAVARIPGKRAKIAVQSYDDRIDPVGACVGVKGSRIHGIVRELHNENIDVINWTADPALLIERALSPANVSNILLFEDDEKRYDDEKKKFVVEKKKRAEVFLRPEEVSLAIGKDGINVKLASQLTGYQIDVYRETDVIYDDDIYIHEFQNEFESWIIDTLKDAGFITAKSILSVPRQEIIRRTDLEEETVDYVINVLKKEYEDDDEEAGEPEACAEESDPAEDIAEAAEAAETTEPASDSHDGEEPAASEETEEAEAPEAETADAPLDDFRKDVEGWIVDALKAAGYTMARMVIEAPREEVADKADLEEETVDDVVLLLKYELGYPLPLPEESDSADDDMATGEEVAK